jgi:hypothetical protein
MKIEVLGREVDVGWKKFGLYLGLLILFYFALVAFDIAYALFLVFAQGMDFPSAILAANDVWISSFLTYIKPLFQPLLALALLVAAGRFGMKKSVSLCRSFAASEFIIFGLGGAALDALLSLSLIYWGKGAGAGNPFFSFADIVIGGAFGAIMLYLWLLIFLDLKRGKLGWAAWNAGAYALIFFMLPELYNFFLAYQSGNVYAPKYNFLGILVLLISNFLFALPVLYHAYGKKIGQDAYVFAAIFLLPAAMYAIGDSIIGAFVGPAHTDYFGASLVWLALGGRKLLELAALYLLAQMKNAKLSSTET